MARKPRQPAAYVTCQHCGRKFRAITVFHLRKIHGYEDDHPVLEYKSEFNLSFAMSPDSRKKISEAKEDFWAERGQHWTPEDVVTEIQRIHRAGGCLRRNNVPVKLYEVGRRHRHQHHQVLGQLAHGTDHCSLACGKPVPDLGGSIAIRTMLRTRGSTARRGS
jgi:hypothetical protein